MGVMNILSPPGQRSSSVGGPEQRCPGKGAPTSPRFARCARCGARQLDRCFFITFTLHTPTPQPSTLPILTYTITQHGHVNNAVPPARSMCTKTSPARAYRPNPPPPSSRRPLTPAGQPGQSPHHQDWPEGQLGERRSPVCVCTQGYYMARGRTT